MSPNLLKAIALALVAAMGALENAQVLPAGISATVGGALVYAAGLYHPSPSKASQSK